MQILFLVNLVQVQQLMQMDMDRTHIQLTAQAKAAVVQLVTMHTVQMLQR